MRGHREATKRLFAEDLPPAGKPIHPKPRGIRGTEPPPIRDLKLLRLSEAIREYLHERKSEVAQRTWDDDRIMLWSLVEFVRCDPPTRELSESLGGDYLAWLRQRPRRCRKRGELPGEYTPGAVAQFLRREAMRPQALFGDLPNEQTVGHYWRVIGGFLRWLKIPVQLRKRDRPNLTLPQPLVPTRADAAVWWREYLTGRSLDGTPIGSKQRRRIVLVQGLLLLTGMRLSEALAAQRVLREGRWLLLAETKTHKPRIVYLSRQALGIVQALQDLAQPQRRLFQEPGELLLGWTKAENTWIKSVGNIEAPHAPTKPHQAQRQICSSFMHRRDPAAESAQLGHGSGVVAKHYLDVIRRVPPILEKLRLPEVEGFAWPSPILAEKRIPVRLWEEFRKLVSRRAMGNPRE